ncbi:hypothetical protein [Lacihabitans lacunae]|uniref:DUF4131 domain-containing protein n=1 Tax=Lacihabitans lacunae TaxID=1028214 RepID=A0ABV7YZC4_9BACT
MKFKPLYSSIPVLVLGLLITYLLFLTGCGGIVEIYSSIFLAAILIMYVVGYSLYSIATHFDNKTKINWRPLLLSLIFIGLIFIFNYFDSEKFNSKVILKATNNKAYGTIDIRLRENNKVEFYYGHIEEKCSCEGEYLLKGDTIQIKGIQKSNRLETFDRYLITNEYVIPIKEGKLEQDTSKYLKRFGEANAR